MDLLLLPPIYSLSFPAAAILLEEDMEGDDLCCVFGDIVGVVLRASAGFEDCREVTQLDRLAVVDIEAEV